MGNAEGLTVLSDNRELRKRVGRLQKEVSDLKRKHAPIQEDWDLMHTSELLTYLPFPKDSGRQVRNQVVHGARIKYDLDFYERLLPTGQTYVSGRLVKTENVKQAFNNRYGYYPEELKKNCSEIPEHVLDLMNLKANLAHLTFWKESGGETLTLRDSLARKCSDLICRWLNPSEDRPYSKSEAEQLLENHRSWSISYSY